MRVTVRNLGVIKEAEIDLKPLTVFIGPNNTGKTWIASMLAGIFGQYGSEKYMAGIDEILEAYPNLKKAVQELIDDGSTKIDLVQFAEQHGESYINNVARLARHWMQEFMDTERTSFENLEVSISLADYKKQVIRRVLSYSLDEDEKLAVGNRRKPLVNAHKEQGDPSLYFFTTESIKDRLPLVAINGFVLGLVFQVIHGAFYSETYTLPMERTTYIALINAGEGPGERAPTSRQTARSEGFRIPMQPVWDFLTQMSYAGRVNLALREDQAKEQEEIAAYLRLAQLLETKILSGHVDFSTPRPDLRREIIFQPAEGVFLELRIVSSMVKELSPLVLYLRYLAGFGNLVVIDEPEMSLHPEAQVQLMEFLAMMVNAGLNVLFTTHSPYMIDHLVSLMKAAEHEDQEAIKNLFYLKRSEAFIHKEHVSVYSFGEGTARSILDEEGRIGWDTFADVSDRINEIYYAL